MSSSASSLDDQPTRMKAFSAIRRYAPWGFVWREAALAAVIGVISTVMGVLALHISIADLGRRWTTGGPDQVLHYTIFTSATDVFPFFGNDRLGFPAAQNLFFAPLFDPWSAVFVRATSLLGLNGIVSLNLYYVLSFFACGVTAYLFFRALRTRRWVASTFGVMFAVVPFHFYQLAIGHPFLANYAAVPLIGILALMVAGERTNPFVAWIKASTSLKMRNARRLVPIIVLGLAVAWTQSYYYVFGAIIVGGVWLFASLGSLAGRRSFKTLLWPTYTLAIFVGLIGVQLAVLSLNFGDRYQKYFAGRTAADSELYGGKITSLLLPSPGSGIEPFAKISAAYQNYSPIVPTSENPWTAVVASIGMILLMAAILTRLFIHRNEKPLSRFGQLVLDPRVSVMGMAFIWGLLFYLTAGLGAVFAHLVSPEIRAWSRLSIVLALCGLAFLALAIDAIAVKRRALLSALAIVAIIGFVDQIPAMSAALPLQASSDKSIATYVSKAEKVLPTNCGVVQLPVKGFPETGNIGGMGDYDEGLPYVYASRNSLRWSYGAVIGTHAADNWRDVSTPGEFGAAVARSGACAVQVDTTAYAAPADWKKWVAQVANPDSPLLTSSGSHPRYILFAVPAG